MFINTWQDSLIGYSSGDLNTKIDLCCIRWRSMVSHNNSMHEVAEIYLVIVIMALYLSQVRVASFLKIDITKCDKYLQRENKICIHTN